ncbi:MAG: hypothetical protein ACKVOW_04205 [Chitinophagaceae bacterium]
MPGMILQLTPTLHREVLDQHTQNFIGNGKYLEHKHQFVINHLMHIQPIHWKYIGKADCLWLGTTNGLLSHIEMKIIPGEKENEFLIFSNITGFEVQRLIEIENTKRKAQELLNSYAFSLIIS